MKRCSICGSEPKLDKHDLGRPNGRGYPGNYDYTAECPKCKMIKASTTDIYDGRDGDTEVASDRIKRLWDERCLEVNAYLRWRLEVEQLNPFIKDLVIALVRGEIQDVGPLKEKLIQEIEKI